MVERFHRQLKAAQPSLDGYSPSRDSDCSAEMVYGTTLRLPGEFFSPSPTNSLPDPSAFIDQLKIESGNQSPPIETSHSWQSSTCVCSPWCCSETTPTTLHSILSNELINILPLILTVASLYRPPKTSPHRISILDYQYQYYVTLLRPKPHHPLFSPLALLVLDVEYIFRHTFLMPMHWEHFILLSLPSLISVVTVSVIV